MYQKSVCFTKYTSFSRWLTFPFRAAARRYFPILYKSQTGLDLQKDWRDPPINSVTKTYINKMRKLGFEPEQDIDEEYYETGVSLPLLMDRRQLGGFLVAYKPRRKSNFLKWVKYTHPELVGPETPLMAIPEPITKKPDGYIVDNLSDYFKLLNWMYCQPNTYAFKTIKNPASIIYVDQGDEHIISKLINLQIHFRNLTDFSGNYVDEIKVNIKKTYRTIADILHYYDTNPLTNCTRRIDFEDIMAHLKMSYLP